MKTLAAEFFVTLAAMLIGLVIARQLSYWMENAGVPIAGGSPEVKPLPEAA